MPMQPSPSAETSRLLLPSLRFSISRSSFVHSTYGHGLELSEPRNRGCRIAVRRPADRSASRDPSDQLASHSTARCYGDGHIHAKHHLRFRATPLTVFTLRKTGPEPRCSPWPAAVSEQTVAALAWHHSLVAL